MGNPAKIAITILIAAESLSDATVVRNLLLPEFEHVVLSTNMLHGVSDFDQHNPDVLVLAFKELESAERYFLSVHRLSNGLRLQPRRTVILCGKDEVKRAYELCMKDFFDDYVLFWPMTFDASRLLISVHKQVRELLHVRNEAISAEELASQAHRLADLVEKLDQKVGHHDSSENISHVNPPPQEVPHLKPDTVVVKEVVSPVVLVVDDDDFQHKIIGRILAGENYHLEFAFSGEQALEILHKLNPDIILMDVMMPHMDGIEATRRLRKVVRLAKTPVIMFTGNSEKKTVIDCFKAGASDFLVKPVEHDTLIAKVAHALGNVPKPAT